MTILSTRVERSRNQVERDSAVYVICGDGVTIMFGVRDVRYTPLVLGF